jgi:hypothetical protein
LNFNYSIVILALSLLLGACSPATDIAQENQYGVLRVPLPLDCELNPSDLNLPFVQKVEVVNFDLPIDGMNTNAFLHIQHKGLPDQVLTPLRKALEHCSPNMKVTYDTPAMLSTDLDEYKSLSAKQNIYMVVNKGEFIVYYKSPQ